MKKTLIQITEEDIVVAEEVVGIKYLPPYFENDRRQVAVLLNGGHLVEVPLEDGMTMLDVASQIFNFTTEAEADDGD